MNKSALDELLNQIEKLLTHFDTESKKHKHMFRWFSGALIALSTISTVLAGAAELIPELARVHLPFELLVTTALSTALGAFSEMRRPRELWQHEREVYYGLLDLQREVLFLSTIQPLTEEELKSAFGRMQRIVGAAGKKWFEIQKDDRNRVGAADA